jgi:hypothetical protein
MARSGRGEDVSEAVVTEHQHGSAASATNARHGDTARMAVRSPSRRLRASGSIRRRWSSSFPDTTTRYGRISTGRTWLASSTPVVGCPTASSRCRECHRAQQRKAHRRRRALGIVSQVKACEICGLEVANGNLARHVKRKHPAEADIINVAEVTSDPAASSEVEETESAAS